MVKRVIVEQPVKDAGKATSRVRRSVSVNQVESPLGWLHRPAEPSISAVATSAQTAVFCCTKGRS